MPQAVRVRTEEVGGVYEKAEEGLRLEGAGRGGGGGGRGRGGVEGEVRFFLVKI